MLQTKIGLTVKALRLERGLSQEILAFESNLHRTYIGAVERGERKITVATLKKVTDALGIKLSDFMVLVEKEN
jgi:transcriptional regulator with XRE-family HTH domain